MKAITRTIIHFLTRLKYDYTLLPHICGMCKARGFPWYRCISFTVKNRRLNTRYVNDESNYNKSCLSCYIDTYDFYQDMWDSYYSGLF